MPSVKQYIRNSVLGVVKITYGLQRVIKINKITIFRHKIGCHSRSCNKKEEIYTKKTKSELKTMENEISTQYGCFLNITEVSKVLGISGETARKLVADLPCDGIGNTKKYYIYDVLKYLFTNKCLSKHSAYKVYLFETF